MPLPIRSVALSLTSVLLLLLSGCGGGSSPQSATDPTLPPPPAAALAAPATVAATTDAGQVTLQWEPVVGAASYAIYMVAPASSTALTHKVKYAQAETSPYIVTGLNRGQTYLFTVVAVTAEGAEGVASAEISARLSMAATALVTGAEHSCALLADGAVKCWGRNNASQLGSAVVDYSASPVAVPGVANAKAISVAGQHSCAVLTDGSMQCWGTYYGKGSGAVTFTSPVVVGGIANAVSVASAGNSDCALLSDGAVMCFAPATPIALFLGSAIAGTVINGVVGARQIAAGVDFTCALLGTGAVTCWNTEDVFGGSARALPNIVGATAITARGDQACALMPAGVQCWKSTILSASLATTGGPAGSPVSLATTSSPWAEKSFVFTQVQSAVNGVKALAVGTGASPSAYFAIMDGGAVQAWNALPLGVAAVNIQTIIASSPPLVTSDPLISPGDNPIIIRAAPPMPVDSEGWLAQSPIQAIWVGQTITTKSFSTPFSATLLNVAPITPPPVAAIPVSVPVLVTDLINVATIANGNAHGCALLLSGDVTCWGDNQYGQLGRGKTSDQVVSPAAIEDL